jgi:acetylornithine deacetylase/succinyl-diaminopimelate desuccinylase-like protein
MDTVAVDGMTIPPFEPRIEDGRMFGRGACDTKSSLAAMMVALVRVASDGPPPRTVVLAAAVDEEYLHGGVARFLQSSGPVASAVIGEPTGLRVVVAHKGALRVRVITRGVSAHSSNPDSGVNAIYRMARVVRALEDFAEALGGREPHPLVGRPTLSVGTISGGNAVNVVPDRCEIMVDRRLIPGETPDGAYEEIADLLDGLLGRDDEMMHTLKDCAVETDAGAPIVKLAREAVRAGGVEDEPMGVAYCTDGCDFAERGVPLVVLGPGDIAQAHTAEEWIEIAQVEQAAEVYEWIMRGGAERKA